MVVDRRREPSHGYRAVHIIVTVLEKPIEIQVRTEIQHFWAQLSEKLSDLLDPAIKYGGGEPEIREILSSLSKDAHILEELEPNAVGREAAETLSRLRQTHREFLEYWITKLSNIRKED